MIQEKDYFGRWIKNPEIDETMLKNARVLIAKVSDLLSRGGFNNPVITSGYRPISYNKSIGGSANSAHCHAMAIDIADPTKEIGKWCLTNIEQLQELGLAMESLSFTHGDNPNKCWVHLTTRKPKSGRTVFIP